ncbi:tape-measure protein, partial [Streptomyces sp. NPDC004779]
MSSALAMPRLALPRFQVAVGPMRNLRQGATAATGAARNLRQAAQRASSGVGALVTAARNASTATRTLGQNSTATRTALDKLRRSPAAARLKRVATAAGKARRAAGRIGTAAGAVLGLLLPLLPVADVITGLMGTFGTVMTLASVAMTGVNVAMRANPLGFLVGLIVPIAAYLIELAVTSETGQRIIRQVLQKALKGFQSVWNFISPFMKALGKAIGTYAKAYLTVFTSALKIVGSAIGGIARIGSAVRSASNALGGIASRTLGGVKSAVQPVVR